MEKKEAMKILKEFHDKSALFLVRTALDTVIPELKESEDERIRKRIIHALHGDVLDMEETTKAIAWLEKQGEQKSIDPDTLIEQRLDALADIVAERKSADKAEPKFHKGDWIVHHGTENIYQVVAIINNQYQLKYGDNYTVQKCADVDRCARLYDITKDAKDGDVLSYRDGQWIFIYREKIDDNSFYYHTLYSTIHQDLTINDSAFTLLGDEIIPATKEQRDLLFQKMKEAGYEWDAEKKELKKIEQKSVGWSEEDEKAIQVFKNIVKHSNEIDENIYTMPLKEKLYDWLKSIKDRVKPKQEWSEEDEKEVAVLEAYIRSKDWSERHIDRALGIVDELVNKVKSLRHQKQWKPSEEQIHWLKWAINRMPDTEKANEAEEVLEDLLEQLKKL